MTPSQFWALHPYEFWWLAEYYMDKSKDQKMYGSLTEREVEQLYRDTYGDGNS